MTQDFPTRKKIIDCLGLFLVLTVVLSALPPPTRAEGAGYDENTEVVVRGLIRQTVLRPFLGYQCVMLQSSSQLYRVLTTPPWFAKKIGLDLYNGLRVEVVGSKFYGTNGDLCLLAKSIAVLPSGEKIILRDRGCKPIWERADYRESSCMRIFYHVSK